MTTTITRNDFSTGPTLPAAVISRKRPKIYMGRTGMITFSMLLTIIFLASSKPFSSADAFVVAMPIPTTNDRTSAVITSHRGGMAMVKYGAKTLSAASSSASPPASTT